MQLSNVFIAAPQGSPYPLSKINAAKANWKQGLLPTSK